MDTRGDVFIFGRYTFLTYAYCKDVRKLISGKKYTSVYYIGNKKDLTIS